MRIWKIDVPGIYGYSFAVKGEINNEVEAVEMAFMKRLFSDVIDSEYAMAVEITDSPYDIKGLENCTYEV